jgi:hypothetical protein
MEPESFAIPMLPLQDPPLATHSIRQCSGIFALSLLTVALHEGFVAAHPCAAGNA